jgi:hypothetical protein
MFRAVTKGALVLGVALALTPGFFAAGPWLESRIFPVTTAAEVLNEEPDLQGVNFEVRFRKLRRCRFLGLAWYVGERRVPVNFEPDAELSPSTRPVGGQIAGPWRLPGVRYLAGTRAWALHQCHPLWITFTKFYEG